MNDLNIFSSSQNEKFDRICNQVSNCTKCPRMSLSSRILNRSVGNISSQIMFIGEAPGRLGADASGIPFHGDKAGHNFEELLTFAKLDRNEVYVTNAVLCNPRDDKGNNATPNNNEIENCSVFLKNQIDIVDPKIVVTLGAKALQALNYIEHHTLTLKDSTRSSNKWYKRILIPCYHPGQRAMIHRSMGNQRSDYQFIADVLKSFQKKKNLYHNQSSSEFICVIAEYILKAKGQINYFALHKIFYLLEYNFFLKYGTRLTTGYFVRQKDGPYCTDLHLRRLQNSIAHLNVKSFSNGTIILSKDFNTLFVETLLNEHELDNSVTDIIDSVLNKYGNLSMAKLKSCVYLSRPMRNILYIESERKINLYNSPIDFTSDSIY